MKAIIPYGATYSGFQPVPKPYKSVYLLHGIMCGPDDWLYSMNLRDIAHRCGVAVFIPAGENSFYLDDLDRGSLYGEYVGREIVEATRNMFCLSEKREDTCIAGFSMGGFGAIRNGIKYSEIYGGIVALSSALVQYIVPGSTDDRRWHFTKRRYFRSVFGDLDGLAETDNDPECALRILKSEGRTAPKIYMACGTEDNLLGLNRRYHEFLESEGVDHMYEESTGVHDWSFWEPKLEEGLGKIFG